MVAADRVVLTIDGGVAHLELNRANERNAIDAAMVEAVDEAVSAVEADRGVRSLLLSGRGRSFCVGGDLAYFAERLDTLGDEFRDMVGVWHTSTLPRLAALPFPVVTAVHGGTAGGGLGLVWCADHVIAGESTKIATGFADLGVSGDGGSSWHLPRLVGLRRAQEMLLENRVVDAPTALDWGLVNSVVPDADLTAAALETARRFAMRSVTATGNMKRLLLQSTSNSYAAQLSAEYDAMQDCALKSDVREGMPSFLGKRTPVFADR